MNIDVLPERKKLCLSGCWTDAGNNADAKYLHHKERLSLRQLLKSEKSNFIDIERAGVFDYIKLLLTYKFQISPKGAGVDCHRTW